MAVLIVGLALFLLPHLLREFGLRDVLVERFPSSGAYKGAYSLITLLGLVLIVVGFSRAPFITVWVPPFDEDHLAMVLMGFVFWMILSAYTPWSFVSVKLRNPMVAGVAVWGFAHLLVNGDLASMLLFGGFTLWGAVKFINLWRATEVPEFKQSMVIWDIMNFLLGMVIFWTVFFFHGDLFGRALYP